MTNSQRLGRVMTQPVYRCTDCWLRLDYNMIKKSQNMLVSQHNVFS